MRVSKIKGTFEKGYLPNWSEEIFFVRRRIPLSVPCYELKDYNNENIEGLWYEKELQHVKKEMFWIEKIIKKAKTKVLLNGQDILINLILGFQIKISRNMASFYIFLPSNSNKENKIGNFKVKLPETIRLNGEWEMSLREFNYTRSWYNIGNAEDSHIAILNFPTAPSQTDLSIPFNNYDTPQQLIDAIHFAISQHFLRSYPNTKTPKSISATNSTAAKVKQSTTKTSKSTSKEVKQPTTPKLPTKITELLIR